MEVDEPETSTVEVSINQSASSPGPLQASMPSTSTGAGSSDKPAPVEDKIRMSAVCDLDINAPVMAPPETVGSVTISLHPLVILNISEHWTRYKVEENSLNVEAIGAIIGKHSGRHIEIMNSFELVFTKDGNDIVIDEKYYEIKEQQYKQVFSDLDLLGWYRTGDAASRSDLKTHKQMCNLLESPIFIKLNPLTRQTELPVSVFESVIDVVAGNKVPSLQFVQLNYTLATEEAERIGIDHVARISNNDTADSSLVSENLQAQYNAIKMLTSRVHILAEYVRCTQRGELAMNHEILRQINSLSHMLPMFNNNDFKEEFYNQTNDVILMAHMACVTKSCNALNKYISRFNQLHERCAVGRRRRGMFY